MARIQHHYSDGNLLVDKVEEENNVSAIVNPFANNPYYNDTMTSTSQKEDMSVVNVNPSNSKTVATGWNNYDSMSVANVDDFTKVPKVNSNPFSFVSANDQVDSEEVTSLLKDAYDKIPDDKKAKIEAEDFETGPNLLQNRMDALSKKIDEALRADAHDYDYIHGMMLRFCMIHMRNVVKDDQNYINELSKRIKVQSGEIRNTYNTWPVVCITLISSATSIVGGLAGFSSLFTANQFAALCAKNSSQISTMSSGISGTGSLFSSRNEGDRQILNLYLQRNKDKEDEKKGAKHGTKESQKGLRDAIVEASRNRHDTVNSILR